jgi:hypothetical protein
VGHAAGELTSEDVASAPTLSVHPAASGHSEAVRLLPLPGQYHVCLLPLSSDFRVSCQIKHGPRVVGLRQAEGRTEEEAHCRRQAAVRRAAAEEWDRDPEISKDAPLCFQITPSFGSRMIEIGIFTKHPLLFANRTLIWIAIVDRDPIFYKYIPGLGHVPHACGILEAGGMRCATELVPTEAWASSGGGAVA